MKGITVSETLRKLDELFGDPQAREKFHAWTKSKSTEVQFAEWIGRNGWYAENEEATIWRKELIGKHFKHDIKTTVDLFDLFLKEPTAQVSDTTGDQESSKS